MQKQYHKKFKKYVFKKKTVNYTVKKIVTVNGNMTVFNFVSMEVHNTVK